MKKADLKVGGRYYANVSGKRVEVRIESEKNNGGWEATNLATGKKVHIRTAQRLHGEVGRSGKRGRDGAESEMREVHTDAPAAEAPANEGTPKTSKRKAKSAEPKTKRLSALDAAAKVLAEAGEPLNAKQMVEAMEAKGYWKSPGGKTPHATLYSAILREIGAKGDAARFSKTERGKFVVNA